MVFLPLMLIWLRDPMYFNTPSRWLMVAFAATSGLLAPELASDKRGNQAAAADLSQSASSNSEPNSPSAPALDAPALLREGTRLTERVGQLSRSDDGWFFTVELADSTNKPEPQPASIDTPPATPPQKRPATPSRIRVLENLALQRVAQMIQQDSSDNRWVVNGVITEFFGENRLLILMAVRAPIDDQTKR
jgi:hypothetical protein